MQTLQKVEFDNLATFLATINNNFSIIQNSPLFKGVPGEQGVQGETGSQGDRGTKILPVVFDKFVEVFPELQGQYVSALSPDFINSKLLNDDESNTNFNLICDALGLDGDSLIDGDMLLFATDLMIYAYEASTNQLVETGIKFATDINIQETINTLIENSMQEYLEQLNAIKVYLKQYTTIASNDGATAAPTVSNATTYFPYIPIGNMPRQLDVTNQDVLAIKHKYFGIDDSETSQANDYYNDSSFGVTTVLGSIRQYVKILRNGTNQNLSGNIINPTNNRMPSLVVMQNNYESGLVIGHKNAENMSQYTLMYRDSAGSFHIKREHKWNLTQQVTELVLGAGFVSCNSNFKLTDHANMISDFLTSNYLQSSVDFGYSTTNSKITFKSRVLNFAQFTGGRIMETDNHKNLTTNKRFDVAFENTLNASNYQQKLNQYFGYNTTGTLTDTEAINLIPSQKTIKYVFKSFAHILEDVWYKPEYYILASGFQTFDRPITIDRIPSMKLYKDFIVGSDYLDGTMSQLIVEEHQIEEEQTEKGGEEGEDGEGGKGKRYQTMSHPLEIHLINIGAYNIGYDVMFIGRYNQEGKRLYSRLDLHMDWHQLILDKMAKRSVLTVGDNHIVDEDFQYADWTDSKNDFEYLVQQDIHHWWLKNENFDFTKYANRYWNDHDGHQREGFSGANNMGTDDLTRRKRYLTGRHFRVLMVIFNEISYWFRYFLNQQQEQNQNISQDLVPEGVVVPYNPPINMKDGRDYKYFGLPNGWIPCLGGFLLETTTSNPASESSIVCKYPVPDMRCKSVIGYDWDTSELYNASGDFLTTAHMQHNEVDVRHKSEASDKNIRASLLSATNYLNREDEWALQHASGSGLAMRLTKTEYDTKVGNSYEDTNMIFDAGRGDIFFKYEEPKEGVAWDTYNKFMHMHPFVRLVYIQKAVKPKVNQDNYIWYKLRVGICDVFIPIYWPNGKPNVIKEVNHSYSIEDIHIDGGGTYYSTGGNNGGSGSGSGTGSSDYNSSHQSSGSGSGTGSSDYNSSHQSSGSDSESNKENEENQETSGSSSSTVSDSDESRT